MSKIKSWTLKDLRMLIRERQLNNYDCNVAVSGPTGSGKTTFVLKLVFGMDNFKPWKQIVYDRESVIDLITSQNLGICVDDEAMNSSYKRGFQQSRQQQLIKAVAMYRSNFNLYFAVLPEFFSLDKDLRNYYAIHIFVIERGLAVIFRRDTKSLFAEDRWYTKYNMKVEETFRKKNAMNPKKYKYPYHHFKGFVAYIKFGDLTKNQRELAEEIKEKKRKEAFEVDNTKKETPFIEKVMRQMKLGKITEKGLQEMCLMEEKKYSSIRVTLNRMLKDEGDKNTSKYYFELAENQDKFQSQKETEELLGDI